MIKATVIHGSDAVKEFERTGQCPTPEWAENNAGAIVEKEFASMSEYQAYIDALEENDGYLDWRVLPPSVTETTGLDVRLQELSDCFIKEISRLPLRPEGWLPHIVFVEEEGTYPVYTMYRLEEVRTDGSCTLFNPVTGERFFDRNLYEINIDWLDTVLRRYYECCAGQNASSTTSGTLYDQSTTSSK